MSSSTHYNVQRAGMPLDDDALMSKMADITRWLQDEWSNMEKEFGDSTSRFVPDLIEKAPVLLTKLKELTDLKRQESDRIQQHEARWRQAVEAPHTADQSKALGENARWRKNLDETVYTINAVMSMIAAEGWLDGKHIAEEVIKRAPQLLKALDEANELQQERLSEIEQCKSNWVAAIAARKGELADLDELVANKQPAVEAAKLATDAAVHETRAQQFELSRVQSEIQQEGIRLTSLLHQRMDADIILKENEAKAKQQEQSLQEKRRSYDGMVAKHEDQIRKEYAQIDEMKQTLNNRERLLAERQQQLETNFAEKDRVRFLAEQKLEDERMSLQGERETLKGDVEGVQTQLKLMCDYREAKDGQVSYANERYDKAKEYVTQHEKERESLQKMVTNRDTRLEGLRKKLTEANRSLRAKNDLVVESERQATQLTVDKERLSEEVQTLKTQIMQSEGELRSESMTRMDTLNGNIVQVLGSLEVYSKQNTELITKAKHMEESVIPALKAEAARAQHALAETQLELDSVNTSSEILIGESQAQVIELEQQLLVKEKALSRPNYAGVLIMSSPEDRATLDRCSSDHSDIDSLRQRLAECEVEMEDLIAKYQEDQIELQVARERLDSAKEEIRQLHEKQLAYDDRESRINELEKQRREAETRLAEQQDRIKTLDNRLEDFEGQLDRNQVLNAQVLEWQNKFDATQSLNSHLQGSISALSREKRDLSQAVITIAAERTAAVSATSAALEAQKSANRKRDEVIEALKHASEDNRTAANEIQNITAERNRLMRQLDLAFDKGDEATQRLIGPRNQSSNLSKGQSHPRQAQIGLPQPGLDNVQHEMLDDAEAEAANVARSLIRLATDNGSHNSINVPEQDTTSEDMANITHRSRSQAPFSRKRVANDQLHDDREQRRPYRVGQSGEGATGRRTASDNDGTATPEQQAGRVSAGAPITNPPDPQRFIYPIDDAWDENFGDGRIPATVVNKLRSQMKGWSKKKPNWTGSDRRRCANSFASRKPGDREDMHGCDACAGKSLICVAVYQNTIELLPLKDAGQASKASISGEGHWFRRKMD